MPEFRTAPEALTDAARAVGADARAAEVAAAVLGSSWRVVATALPTSRTAAEADRLAAALPAAAHALTTELATIAGALAVAARDYVAAEEAVAGDVRRPGRWSA